MKFVSLAPYRIIVSGRTKHFISAFGEHVIGEEVEQAMLKASAVHGAKVTEYTVAPMIQQGAGKSYHEWLIEFEAAPADLQAFNHTLNEEMRSKNVYYDDLMKGNILLPLQISVVAKNGFIDYMKSIGKLGGQNKVPRLSNNREIAEAMKPFIQR